MFANVLERTNPDGDPATEDYRAQGRVCATDNFLCSGLAVEACGCGPVRPAHALRELSA